MTARARGLLVVVTGLSGAGKSTALRALEDLGFFCVDNLPTTVFSETLAACDAGGMSLVALGIDVRVRSFLVDVGARLDALAASASREIALLFLDASDEALLRRFSETRRPHPLSTVPETGSERGALAVLDGVRLERDRLAPLRAGDACHRHDHALDPRAAPAHRVELRPRRGRSASDEHPLRVVRLQVRRAGRRRPHPRRALSRQPELRARLEASAGHEPRGQGVRA